MQRRLGLLLTFLLIAACSSGTTGGSTRDGGVDTGPPVDAARPADAAADASADASVDAPVDSAPPPPEVVRFIAMGDTGEANDGQRAVALAIENLCAAEGCDFVLLLGDNIYDSGVSSVDDPQWAEKFEDIYAGLDIPFMVVLGNHDYGGSLLGFDQGGLGNEWDKGSIEVEYSDHSDLWTMPATHYTFTWGNVGFIMLDTNSILWDNNDNGNQRDWYTTALMEVSGSDWIFGAGHHPYRSNGRHGNAGSYESIEVGGVEIPLPVPILDGRNMESFFDDVVCGTVDFYLSGHDHNRQWLDESDRLCGTEMIVTGAGAKLTDLQERGNSLLFGDDTTEGFAYFAIEGDTLTGRFYDSAGVMNFERVVTR